MINQLGILVAKLKRLFRKRTPDFEFDHEMHEHLRLLTERHIRAGMTPGDANAAARRQFGNTTLLREERTEMQTIRSLETLWRDVRYGGRQFRLNPLFTAIRIIGVVENSLFAGPRAGVRRQVFLPYLESASPAAVTFYARTARPAAAIFASLRQILTKLDSSVPVYDLKTLENQLDETLSTERLIAFLSSVFGLLATMLAALGLYGVMAFVVTQRTGEIGLRMALGAPRSSVLWLVMCEMLILLAGGLAVGVPVAYVFSRYVSSQLFGVTPADLWTGVGAVALLSLMALIAGFAPARRASAIDPIAALRYE